MTHPARRPKRLAFGVPTEITSGFIIAKRHTQRKKEPRSLKTEGSLVMGMGWQVA